MKSTPDQFLASYAIGLKLRTLRSEKRLTLSRLAAEARLSTALLSKIETDQMTPTLHTLGKICRIYGIGLSYFFSDPKRHSLAITRKAHLGMDGRGVQSVNRIPLHAPTAGGRLVAKVIDLPPGLLSTASENGGSPDVIAYVLEGGLQLDIAGSQEILETGDCAVFTTDEMVLWRAAGDTHCRILSVSAK